MLVRRGIVERDEMAFIGLCIIVASVIIGVSVDHGLTNIAKAHYKLANKLEK